VNPLDEQIDLSNKCEICGGLLVPGRQGFYVCDGCGLESKLLVEQDSFNLLLGRGPTRIRSIATHSTRPAPIAGSFISGGGSLERLQKGLYKAYIVKRENERTHKILRTLAELCGGFGVSPSVEEAIKKGVERNLLSASKRYKSSLITAASIVWELRLRREPFGMDEIIRAIRKHSTGIHGRQFAEVSLALGDIYHSRRPGTCGPEVFLERVAKTVFGDTTTIHAEVVDLAREALKGMTGSSGKPYDLACAAIFSVIDGIPIEKFSRRAKVGAFTLRAILRRLPEPPRRIRVSTQNTAGFGCLSAEFQVLGIKLLEILEQTAIPVPLTYLTSISAKPRRRLECLLEAHLKAGFVSHVNDKWEITSQGKNKLAEFRDKNRID